MNNFYLIGMPGCGKSTIGLILSEMTKMPIIDLDNYIVENQKHTISDIFKNNGENYFRNIETKCLKCVSLENKVIVSTGGGIVKRAENIDIMKNTGKIIFIDTTCKNILKNSSLKNRPLLADDKNKIFDLYEERYEMYLSSADFVCKNDSSAEVAAKKISDYILNNL